MILGGDAIEPPAPRPKRAHRVPMIPELFVLGRRAEGTLDLIDALSARSEGRHRKNYPRVDPGAILLDRPSRPSQGEGMINEPYRPYIVYPGPRELVFRTTKRSFVALHGGDGLDRIMERGRRACDGVLWSLSALREYGPQDEALVDDVLSAVFCGARSITVFIHEVLDRESADRCERFARKVLDDVGLQGDRRTFVRDTGLTRGGTTTAWHEGIDQLYDALDQDVVYPSEPTTPLAMMLDARDGSRAGGTLRGGALRVGDEVALALSNKRTRIQSIRNSSAQSLTELLPDQWGSLEFTDVIASELDPREAITGPFALRPTREVRGVACALNDRAMPERIRVVGYACSAVASVEWLDPAGARRGPRRATLRFDEPVPWLDGDRALLVAPRGIRAVDEPLLWTAAFDHRA